MGIIISHKSALEYWRNWRLNKNAKIADFVNQRRISLPTNLPNRSIIRDGTPPELSYPISLLVGSQNAKRKSKIVQSRVYTGPTPKGCFINIGDGLIVSSPPFCFFQMAGELPLVKLIELGFEFCGSYSLLALPANLKQNQNPEDVQEDDIEGAYKNLSRHTKLSSYPQLLRVSQLYEHPQLTNVKEIKTFIAQMKDVRGQKKADRALRFIVDRSASPMETILFMLLTLPYKLGGYGLPAPELNKRIDIKNSGKYSGKLKAGKSYYVCDLFWAKEKLAIEYDSDIYHTGADRIASDSEKRLILAMLGITVVTVTNKQIRNRLEFENLVKLIAGKLHKRLWYKKPQFLIAERELRDLLL